MTWTRLQCSLILLFSFVKLVLADTNIETAPLLVSVDPSLVFLSELSLVKVKVSGQNFNDQNIGNIRLYNRQCSCHIKVTVVSFSRNEVNLSLSATTTETTTTGVYRFVITTSTGNSTSNFSIEVVEDPRVTDVRPKQIFSMGGIRLTIYGTGFNRSGETRIEVSNTTRVQNEDVTSQACASRSDSKMVCILPKLNISDVQLHKDHQSQQQTIGVDLLIRNKILPLPMQQLFNFTTERPVFVSVSGLFVYKPDKHTLLDISGSKILLGCATEDYTVWLGSYKCPVTEATDQLLTFAPPKSKPVPSGGLYARFKCDQYNGALPLLVVLGDPDNSSATFFIRCLTYEGSNELAFQLGVGIGVGLFILLLLAVSVGMLVHLCLRHSKQKMKDLAWEHNVKVVQEFIEKKEKMDRMACIPAILQMTSDIHEKKEMSQHGIFEKHRPGDTGPKGDNFESKTDVAAAQQLKITTTAEVTQATDAQFTAAQDSTTSQDDIILEGQPSTSYEEFSNSELNSQEEVSQNLLRSDCEADVGRNLFHLRVNE